MSMIKTPEQAYAAILDLARQHGLLCQEIEGGSILVVHPDRLKAA